MNISLVIMAAGIGSRFGGGIKQLESVGPNSEVIMEYSVHDAIEAGFSKIIFVIRKDIEKDFREAIGNRVEVACHAKGVQVIYAQRMPPAQRRSSPARQKLRRTPALPVHR